MFKNTINKVFQKEFPYNIWKIEVDTFRHYLGIEIRDEQTMIPQYTVLDLDGKIVLENYSPSEKDWMMEGIQKGFVILKKVGENTPIKAGISVVHSNSGQEVFTTYEYQLLDVYEDYIKVRNRSVLSGHEQFMRIEDGSVHSQLDSQGILLSPNDLVFPIVYDRRPTFLAEENITDALWLSKADAERYLWCYHDQHKSGNYLLILTLSDLNQVLHQEVILDNMEKMIPQPYFQVGQQLFFLSQNKQEIVSYLV